MQGAMYRPNQTPLDMRATEMGPRSALWEARSVGEVNKRGKEKSQVGPDVESRAPNVSA